MNINLGCGESKQLGFVGIDKREGKNVDIVADLEKGIPLEDDQVDLVVASHILEHLHDTMYIMDEIWRVCKHDAQVAISVPHYRSIGAWLDPTHVRAFTEHTFDYWDPTKPLYEIYKPKSIFFIEDMNWTPLGNIEAILRVIKKGKYVESKKNILRRNGVESKKEGRQKKGANKSISKRRVK